MYGFLLPPQEAGVLPDSRQLPEHLMIMTDRKSANRKLDRKLGIEILINSRA